MPLRSMQQPKIAQMTTGDIYGYSADTANLPVMETTANSVSGGGSVMGGFTNDTNSWFMIIGFLVLVNVVIHFIPSE